MKIEVGDYIRTVDGVIAKVITISSYYKTKIYHFDNTLYQDWDEDIDFLRDSNLEKIILKHSKNIIDLIEVGDYVNGYKVIDKDDINTGCMCEIYLLEDDGIYGIWDENIKSIVTKEMFESVEYKVGE